MSAKRQLLLQNALALLCEAQRRASDLKHDAQDEIREMTHKLSHQAKSGATTLLKYWDENKENLPKKVALEVDSLFDRIGLAKKTAPKKKPSVKKTAVKKKAVPKKKPVVQKKKS